MRRTAQRVSTARLPLIRPEEVDCVPQVRSYCHTVWYGVIQYHLISSHFIIHDSSQHKSTEYSLVEEVFYACLYLSIHNACTNSDACKFSKLYCTDTCSHVECLHASINETQACNDCISLHTTPGYIQMQHIKQIITSYSNLLYFTLLYFNLL